MQISIIEFSFENFKAFKNRATFSMVARKNDQHTFESNGENLLKTSLIYGPNATGKTSILEAFARMKSMIHLSANISENQESAKLVHTPFLASEGHDNLPTFFEVVFSLKNTRDGVYKYNFSFLPDRIVSEKLVGVSSTGKEDIYFTRTGREIKVELDFKEMKKFVEQVRTESLFLSISAQLNNSFALDLITAFNSIIVVSGVRPVSHQITIKKFKENNEFKEKFLHYLKIADFCIVNGSTQEVETQGIDFKLDAGKFSFAQKKGKDDLLLFEHPVYDTKNEKIEKTFKLNMFQESAGTQKFSLSLGPIIDALEGGKILFIDEFDNSLHPLLTKFIIDLFESNEVNKNNAQLIATTHDTSLLSYKDDFVKDQFWFTEKDELGGAKLFSLSEFNMRNDTEYAKKYLEGRFGALPFVGSVKK